MEGKYCQWLRKAGNVGHSFATVTTTIMQVNRQAEARAERSVNAVLL